MRKLIFSTALVLLLQFLSCNTSSNSFPAFHPDFIHHISAYTSGVIDRGSNIILVLRDPVVNIEKVEKQLPGLFQFSPDIKGTFKFQDSRTIIFSPEKELSRSTVYQGVFNLGKIKKVDKPLKRFPFRFETKKQKISLHPEGLQMYSDNNPRFMYLTGRLMVNDREELEDVKKCLSATMHKKPLNIKWSSTNNNEFTFRVDSLPRTEKDNVMYLLVNGAPIEAAEKETLPITIVGMGEFRVSSARVQDEPDQIIYLHFSDALSELQSLNGLIKLDGKSVNDYQYSGNKVTIFPKERLKGSHTITFSASIKNILGNNLKEEVEQTIFFEEPKPKLRMVGTGTIVPNAKGVVFPFEAMALKFADVWVFKIYEQNIPQFLQVNDLDETDQLHRVGELVYEGKVNLAQNKKVAADEWTRYTLNLSKFIDKEPGAIYRVMLGFRKSYTFFKCEEGEEDHRTDDDEMYYGYYGNNNSYLQEYSPCDRNFYYSGAISRNILSSDIGLIVKAGSDGLTHVFTNNLITASPKSGVKLSFYNYQNRLLNTVTSNEEGMASIKLKEDPFLLVASDGTQRGYIKLGNGRNKSTSKFDVEGVTVENGIEGLIYAERGVWRPGDSIYTCFVLNDLLKTLPKNVPVTFKLSDPQGKLIKQQVRKSSLNGVYDFRTATEPDATTGRYRAEVTVGQQSFYKTLSIETVQPNRLKIRWTIKDSIIHLGKKNSMSLASEWLHGAIASDLSYSVMARVRAVKTSFKGWEKFHFDDESKGFEAQDRIVANGRLNQQGVALIEPDFNINQQVPGMLQVDLLSKVFEKSGNFSSDYSTYEMSPYTQYVGIKDPNTTDETQTLETDKTHTFQFASLFYDGSPVSNGKLHVKIYRINWNWWWESNRNLSSYMQSNSAIPIMDSTINTKEGKGKMNFSMPYPNWGRFLMVVKDPVSGHTSSKVFYVDWPYWRRANRSDGDESVTLRLSTDLQKYAPGNKVTVSVPSSTTGKALVCIENGSSVLKKFWIDTKKGETNFTFTASSNMAPNAYVHVTYLQPYNESGNDLPVRLYGIVPIHVEDPKTILHPVIEMSDQIRPDRKEQIKISESSGTGMTYTLAVVDDGLLDLTHFKTPNIWSHFYKKRGLGVRTWDLYDDVMGGYAGKWGNVLSVGGDEEGSNAGETTHKANRFVPAVRFLGPFYLPPGKKVTHTIELGDYIGSVRVMVVASQNSAFGRAEKTVKVKKPIMVLTTLPRMLTPGDQISIPVTVFNLEEKKQKVSVKISTEGNLELNGATTKTIDFVGSGDQMVVFQATVPERVGLAKVKVQIGNGVETSLSVTELEVRAPNLMATEVDEYILKPGETKDIKAVFAGMDGTNSGKIEVSGLPPVNLWQRLNELIQYPHGCVEQTTSSVFAQLFLDDFVQLSNVQKVQVNNNINAAIRRLQSFQTPNGGMAYWPGSTNTNEWGTNYAGHFIIAAKNKGYYVNEYFYNSLLSYQASKAKEFDNGNGSDQLTQAYRLYMLAMAGKSEVAAMNRLRESQNVSLAARWRLAAAYVIAGMPETAQLISKNLTSEVGPYKQFDATFGSQLRDKSLLLETLVLMGNEAKGMELLKEVSKALSSKHWLSTQETAYGLISISRFYNKQVHEDLTVSFMEGGKEHVVRSAKPFVQINLASNAKRSVYQTKLTNKGKNIMFVRLIRQGVPLKTDTVSWQKNVLLSVNYSDFTGKTIDPKRLLQGDEFKITVSIKNPGVKGLITQMALNELIPGGWEISNMRMHSSSEESEYTYQDVRDDRVYTYFDLRVGQQIQIELLATATYAGKFYMPSITTQCMYDDAISAKVPGTWVEVIPKPDVARQ